MRKIELTLAAITVATTLLAAQGQQQPPPAQPAQPVPAQQAQPGQPAAKKQPQAKSKEEFDDINKLNDQSLTPEQKVTMGEEFLKKYPQSELKGFAYRKLMEAYQQQNNFDKMREYGEKVLTEDPEDAVSLILLASAIPERTRETDFDRDQKLGQAEDYANRAIKAVDKLAKPEQFSDADWDKVRNDARGQAHAALGLIALNRKQYDAAEKSFKKAVEMQNQKDPIVYWRLGLTYQFQKKYEEARDALKQSVALGGVKIPTADGKIRDVAAEELARVEKFLKDRQAGGAAGAAGAPAPASGASPAAPRP